MNAMKILQSVEELLSEVMSWLLFYPRTLWMTLSHPLRTMKYSDAEQRDKPEKQYLETLSPSLFLVLSILLAHGIELAFGFRVEAEGTEISRLVTTNDQNLLVFRALMFSLHPLLFAWVFLKLSRRKVDRDSLRPPFFAQCYLSGRPRSWSASRRWGCAIRANGRRCWASPSFWRRRPGTCRSSGCG